MPLPIAIAHQRKAEKKRKYVEACLAHHACFTLLRFSGDGMLETEAFIHRLADKLSTKWERPYSAVAG